MIVVTKNAHKLKFNKEIKMKNSFVYGVMLAIKPDKDYLLATVTMANCHRLQDINTLHQKLGHASKALMQKCKILQLGTQKSVWNLWELCPHQVSSERHQQKEEGMEQDARQVAVYWHQPCQKLKLQRLAVLATHCWQCNGFQFQFILENKGSDITGNDFDYTGAAQLKNIVVKRSDVTTWERMLPFRPQQRKKVWASILSSWPTKLCSKMAASNASLPLCLEGSG